MSYRGILPHCTAKSHSPRSITSQEITTNLYRLVTVVRGEDERDGIEGQDHYNEMLNVCLAQKNVVDAEVDSHAYVIPVPIVWYHRYSMDCIT